MDLINDVFAQLAGLKTELLFGLALYVVGVAMKRAPFVPNSIIPLVVVLVLGAGGGFFIFSPGDADPGLKHPEIRSVMLGLIVGAGVWFFHDKIGRYAERLLPAGLRDEPEPKKEK